MADRAEDSGIVPHAVVTPLVSTRGLLRHGYGSSSHLAVAFWTRTYSLQGSNIFVAQSNVQIRNYPNETIVLTSQGFAPGRQ